MARRREEEPEEEEYEEGAEGEGQPEFVEEEEPQGMEAKLQAWIKKSPAFFISLVFHLVILAICATVVFSQAMPEIKQVFVAKREKKTTPYDPEKKRDVQKRPEINKEHVEKPLVNLDETLEVVEIPKGTSMNNLTNKELDSDNVIDAIGVGGGGSGSFGDRLGKRGLLAEGGSSGTESAVQAALLWLSRHQSPDGRWDIDGHQRNCNRDPEFPGNCGGPGGADNNGGGWEDFDVGVTALSLMAFLGNGHTHKFSPDPKFREVVKNGLKWLKEQQRPDGSLGFKPGPNESIYNHALATMCLAEALAMSRDFTLKKSVEEAVGFALKAQNAVEGDASSAMGWKYDMRTGDNDTSVTGWMVFALAAAREAGVTVPDTAFRGALNWFDIATDAKTGLTGYADASGFSSYIAAPGTKDPYFKFERVPCMTAVGVICRYKCGQDPKTEVVKKGLRIIMDSLPKGPDRKYKNLYYWYYGTFAVHSVAGGSGEWKTWNSAMQKVLLESQRQGKAECLDGSWDPDAEWGIAGGRVYTTAIGALTLEVYYRFASSGGH